MRTHPAILLSLVAAVFLACSSSVAAQATGDRELVLEDYSDIVTSNDLGFNDFSGNTGVVDDTLGHTALDVTPPAPPRLHFSWTFPSSPADHSFTGLFESLFGLTDTNVTYDGTNVFTLAFAEHSLDLDDIDHPLTEPGGPRRVSSVKLKVHYEGASPLKLRVELKDADDHVRFQRLDIPSTPGSQDLAWDFRTSGTNTSSPAFDPTRAKLLNLVIEHRHDGDGVENPVSGSLDIERMALLLDNPEVPPAGDDAFIDLLERRSCEYFMDWSSRKPASMDMPQDRSTFADLLTVGGAGFALPASVICAQRGWITRAQALSRVRAILQLLADPTLQGSEKVGRIGFHGFLYHFVGPDGRRKQNFDFPTTPANEALNTVELSTIDTGLAVMGALAAQTYFDQATPDETEVRTLAQQLYDGVDWPFMLDAGSQQLYLGWKPNEARNTEPHFDIPDAGGTGSYSGVVSPARDPATLDYYTDEALIAILLGLGSQTHPLGPGVYCALLRDRRDGLVRTYPGSLFTYEFLHAFLDTASFPRHACPGQPVDDWYANSRAAILAAIGHAESNPGHLPTYGPDAWGISAAEGPGDAYLAYGAPPDAVNPLPDEDGTVTYYAMASAIAFGSDLRARALRALHAGFDREHWHGRFGLPDAFNDDVADVAMPAGVTPLRSSGPWLQRPGFAIDAGPMLLHLENARSGLIWNLIGSNPNVTRALNRLPGSYDCQPQTQTGPLGSDLEDRPVAYLGAFCEDIAEPSLPKGRFVPPLDGHGPAACEVEPGAPFDNVHCFTNLSDVPVTPPLVFRVNFKLPDGTCNNDAGTPSLVQGIEFSMSRYKGGRRWEWALQLENVNASANDGAPQWRVWRPSDASWQPIGVGVPPDLCAGGSWHTFEMRGKITPSEQIHFYAFAIDGVSQMPAGGIPDRAPVTQAGEPDRFAAAVQIDSNSSGQPYTVHLDGLTLKSAAPDTTIDAGPADPTNDATPTFAFSSSELDSTFECQLDADAFAACTSPHTTPTLPDGRHTFCVRATDTAHNTDQSPSCRSFTVDSTAPARPALSGTDPGSPAHESHPKVKGAAEAATTVRVYAASNCGGASAATGSAAELAAPGLTVTVGDNTTTTFTATATDAAGNTSPCSASIAYREDSTPPATTIATRLPSATPDATPTIAFTADEPGSTFACRTDTRDDAHCTSPDTLEPLANGPHTFAVRATDQAGNTDPTPASITFVVMAPPRGCDPAPHLILLTRANDTRSATKGADLVYARGGNDVVRGLSGNDCLFGEQGADRLRGGSGADRLDGGPGRDDLADGRGQDTFVGGTGNDHIDARDVTAAGRRGSDVVRCGAGAHDIALVDRKDRVGRDCERVRRR